MQTEREKQIKIGTATEKFVAKTLKNAGYWVYHMPLKTNGQPCDLVAIKGGTKTSAWLIDAKHVREHEPSFPFSRIEPNQLSAMSYATQFAKLQNVGFAIFFDRTKKLYWLPYYDIIKMQQLDIKSVNMQDLQTFEEALKDENSNN